MVVLDGSIADWPLGSRLDDAATGAAGFGLYGTTDPDFFYFAITSDSGPVGAGTTLWLDTDLDRTTGYQIWGWVGGVEYHVEIGTDNVPRLYSGGPGGTLLGIPDHAYSANAGTLELRIDRTLLGDPDRVRIFSDVNDGAFIPNDYANVNFFVGETGPAIVAGGKTLDGSLGEWSAGTRLDTAATGQAGYALHGDLQDGVYTFALATNGAAIGAGTTIWLDTDLDRATGYQIWGFTGGAEYNVEIGSDGVARLYSGGAGQTLLGEIDHMLSADGTVIELAVRADQIGDPDRVRVFADINNSVHLPNDYSNVNFFVGAAPLVEAGGKVLDGNLGEWAAATRLDTPANGAPGYALHGDLQDGVYTFAMATNGSAIGANTTIWLDADLNRATGHQIWGFAGGAEYNVNFTADGTARLYSGAAGQTLIGALDYALNASGTVLELAIDADMLNGAPGLRVYADVNDAVFLPGDYSTANFIVGQVPAIQIGTTTIDGAVGATEWGAGDVLVDGAYRLLGKVETAPAGNHFVLAMDSTGAPIGAGTTIWLDTDLDTGTGHQIWGWAGGAEYNVNVSADGVARLFSGAAGGVFVADLTYRLAADGSGFEVAIPSTILSGDPTAIRVLADVNDTVFLPGSYAGANLVVSAASGPVVAVDDPGLRIGIVYSDTTAQNYFNITNYGQLFMSAQNQAMQAGIPFDLLSEADLLDPANLSAYDALVFPGFSHVQSGQVDAIADSLATAAEAYGVGLIAAGNFLTNDETGAALPGNSYARMQSLLGVTLEGFGVTEGVVLEANAGANPILNGYAPGSVVGDYGNASYLHFTDATPDGNGQVLFDQIVTGTGAGPERHDGVIATTTAARNVHFATDALIGNNNILGEALDWVATDNAPDVSLLMTRGTSLFYSRNDMDQSQEVYDVIDQNPGIYDVMLPIIEKWYADWGFVGSYYINIGAYAPDQETDWSISKPYFDRILALESEIGSHSYTHPSDTNLLLPDTITDELLDARIVAYSDLVDHGVVCWCPFCMREDADQAVLDALSRMNASEINAMLADTLARTNPANPGAIDPSVLLPVERAVLESSFRFQFEYSKLVIEREMGITVTGAAVPGAPETVETTREIIKFFDYLSGGYSGTGAGYPGAFGYLTPGEDQHVYLAPNMSFDFSLIGFQGLTPEQATDVWLDEFAEITANATAPILAFPWHDYGPTSWDLGDPGQVYTLEMFETFLAVAAAAGTEFVTGEDLAQRIDAFAASTLTVSRTGDVISASVDATDAGHFILDVSDEGPIASVANWYAYSDTAVFLPRNGGTFDITIGTVQADVTHIAAMSQRAELVSVAGDGSDLDFSFSGRGDQTVALATQGAQHITVSGADGGRIDGNGDLILGFDTVGLHTVALDYLAGIGTLNGSAADNLLIGGTGDDVILGAGGADTLIGNAGSDILAGGAGNDVLNGGGILDADTFVFEMGGGNDVVLDFISGVDRLQFVGLGFADAADAFGQFVGVADGISLSFGNSGSVLLADLDLGQLALGDIVVDQPFLI